MRREVEGPREGVYPQTWNQIEGCGHEGKDIIKRSSK